jgi:hypothetical protein
MPSLAEMAGGGIAPYGIRHGGQGVKGRGYFGPQRMPDGSVATEISSEVDGMEHPLMVPTLSLAELQHLLNGAEPTPEMYEKAESHARSRIKGGMSPFAGPMELRFPVPR